MKWPYERRVDPAHAWGVIAVGTAGLVTIPTVLATLHATDSHFQWWWPTNWMIAPAVIFLMGMALVALPVRRSERTTRAAMEAGADGTSIVGVSPDDDNQPRKPTRSLESAAAHQPTLSNESSAIAEEPAEHAFICYVREDAPNVDQLQRDLEAAGISVWRDTTDLWPGEDWRIKIRRAITNDTLVFIACFSSHSTARAKSYQNEELALAIDQLRIRRPDVQWLIPVRFDECPVPDIDLGGGRTLASLQHADLFGEYREAAVTRLLTTVRRLLTHNPPEQATSGDSNELHNRTPGGDQATESGASMATDSLSERFREQWADDITLFSKLKRQPSCQDTSAALRRGSELNIISKHGVRAPLEHTAIYIRIPHPDEWPVSSVIPLHLEERWMEPISVYEWTQDQSFIDAFFSIAGKLRFTGHWEGEQAYNPNTTFEQLADILLYGIEAIRRGFDGVINRIFQIIENDWVVTEWELIDKENHYQILFRRLNELDWVSHVTNKEWVNRNNFLEAFGFAEMLVYRGIFEGKLPPGWKPPKAWPFKMPLDGGSFKS